jgi:ABC-type dipeptide/oligopeptide/nickel transport system permease component
MGGIVLHCDFGPSYASRTRTVNDIFRRHLPVSAQLGALALVRGIGLGVPLGVLAAWGQNTLVDYSAMFITVLGISIPNLALGPLLMWLFGLKLHLLPVATWGTPQHMILPAVTLGTGFTAFIARLTRASVLNVMREDYIRTARAKGLAERVVLVRHILRNAIIPVVTYIGPLAAFVLTGTLIVEQVFAIPGMGRFFLSSIGNRDYPVIMGTTLLFATTMIVANLLADVAYAVLNPRIRHQ